MERWFLAGAVLGLLILIFDKPLADDIIGQLSPNAISGNGPETIGGGNTVAVNKIPTNPTGCSPCAQVDLNPIGILVAPGAPSPVVIVPGQSVQQLGNATKYPPSAYGTSGYGW